MVVTSLTHQIERSCYTQEAKQQEWRSAMSAEFNALIQASTWQLVPYSSSMNVLPNKWVFLIKRKPDGSVERYKARLVAKGFRQQEGVDYGETFSQQPLGFIDPQFPKHVCKLRRSLYGLKQAPRAWFSCFSAYLEDLGFTASQADSSLFVYHSGNVKLYLLIYVDDILITGTHVDHISTLITNLSTLFSMKDLGSLHYFLGIEAVRSSHGLALTQTKYTLDLLHRTNMTDAKPVSTPAASGKRLSINDGTPLHDGTQYRSIVGALQYLTLTHPDISFAVNQVCQILHSLTNVHWVAVKRILRYLKHTPTYGLFYTPSTLHLTCYSDSDYAGDPDTNRFQYLLPKLLVRPGPSAWGGISNETNLP